MFILLNAHVFLVSMNQVIKKFAVFQIQKRNRKQGLITTNTYVLCISFSVLIVKTENFFRKLNIGLIATNSRYL